jgi:MFS family permease
VRLLGPSSPVRSRDYRMLLSGVTVSALGNAMTPVALAFAVLELGGSATQLGLVVAAFAGAEVVTMLFGGVLGDRMPRQLLMQGSATATCLTQAFLATVLIGGHGSIGLLAAIGMVNGCLGALAHPASNALTRFTVTPDQLADAVTLRRLGIQIAMVGGYAAAGMLVAVAGPGWAIAVDAATYAVAAGCFALIRADGPVRADARPSLLSDLGAGAREVFRHTWLWLLIGQATLYHLVYGGVQGVLGPVVVGDVWSEAAWGWALAALMAGFIAGGLVALVWRPVHGLRHGVLLLALTAAFPLAMAVTDQLWLLLLGAALHGFGLELFSVNWDLAIQQNVDEDKLARVYSFDLVGSFVARPLGLVLVGPVTAAVGVEDWLLVVTGIIVVSALTPLALPSVRNLRRDLPAPSRPVQEVAT